MCDEYLETDPNLLIPKARGALERYGHQIVIGNDLNRRKFEVVFVARASASIPASTSASETVEGEITNTWLRLDPTLADGTKEIEEDIIAELVKRHGHWVQAAEVHV